MAFVQCLLSAQAQESLAQNSRPLLVWSEVDRLERLRTCGVPHLLIALAQKLCLVHFPGEMSTIGVEQLEKSWGKKNLALQRQMVGRFLRGLCCPSPSYQNEAGMKTISVPEPGDLL